MIKTRARKIFGDILARKGRTALVSLSIFIGVFGVVTLFSMGNIIVSRLESDIQEDKLAMFKMAMTTGEGAEAPSDDTFLQMVGEQPGVETVQGLLTSQLYFKKPNAEKFEQGFLLGYYDPMNQLQVEPLQLVEGNYPQSGAKQLAVERRMADSYGFKVGDQVVLRLVSQASSAQGVIPEESWTISGIVFQPYIVDFELEMEETVFTTYQDAQYISGIHNMNELFVRYTDFKTAEAQSSNLTSKIANETPYIPFLSILFDPAENLQVADAANTSNVLGILGMVALIVSGFLVVNVINSIVLEQKRQIGVMKSLGATRWDNFIIFGGIALGYGLLGVIPGVILGIPSGYFAAKGMASTMETIVDHFTISPSAIIMGVGIGLAVPVLAALLPVFNGTRVKILDAMTDLGIDSNYGKGLSARFIKRLPLPITVRQGLSNVTQKKGRLAFTMLTLAIAAGAFMGVFALFSSIQDLLDNTFGTFDADIMVHPDQQQDFDTISQLIMDNVEGIRAVQRSNGLQIDIEGYVPAEGDGVFVNGYDPDVESPAYVIKLRDGVQLSETSEPNGVIVTGSIADGLGKEVGDKLVATGAGNSRELTIVGISTFPFDNVWMRWGDVASLAGYTMNGEPIARDLLIQIDEDNPTVKQTADKIDEINEVLLANGITANYQSFPEIIQEITSMVRTFQVIFNLTAALIALVGALGLLTALSMSVFERQKEIGVMRSIGAGSGTVGMQFLTEGMIVGMIAWVVALPLSYGLTLLIIAGLGFDDESFHLGYTASAPVAGLIGMLIITTLASLWPSISASRKTVSDILRYQ